MSHSSSSSTVEFKNEKGVLCYCKELAKIEQAWTDINPGRRFYACKGRKTGDRYGQCDYFRWYDVEKPGGWQHLALLEARDVMRVQKEEIRKLRETARALNCDAEKRMEDPTALEDELKKNREECEALKREVLILNERSRVYRDVLISSTVGFTLVLGIVLVMWK